MKPNNSPHERTIHQDTIGKIGRRTFAKNIVAALGGIGSILAAGVDWRSARAHYQSSVDCTWPTSTTITPSGAPNQIIDLPYSDKTYIQAKLALNIDGTNGVMLPEIFDDGIPISGNNTVVTNISNAYADIFLSLDASEGLSKSLAPHKATIVRGEASLIKASAAETPSYGDTTAPLHLAFVRTSSPRNLVNALANSALWQPYTAANCWPVGVGPYPLWMSTRAVLTGLNLSFDPWQVSNQQTPSGQGQRGYDIHSNLWWLPAMSDAAVHHCHYANFLEIHTQLMGLGRMQKFADSVTRGTCPSPEIFDMPVTEPPPTSSYYGVPGSLVDNTSFPAMYEEYRLAPGDTNVPFAHVDPQGNFIYPWHQYYADTDCLWVVWEMLPIGQSRIVVDK